MGFFGWIIRIFSGQTPEQRIEQLRREINKWMKEQRFASDDVRLWRREINDHPKAGDKLEVRLRDAEKKLARAAEEIYWREEEIRRLKKKVKKLAFQN